jgi:hypothetical protein
MNGKRILVIAVLSAVLGLGMASFSYGDPPGWGPGSGSGWRSGQGSGGMWGPGTMRFGRRVGRPGGVSAGYGCPSNGYRRTSQRGFGPGQRGGRGSGYSGMGPGMRWGPGLSLGHPVRCARSVPKKIPEAGIAGIPGIIWNSTCTGESTNQGSGPTLKVALMHHPSISGSGDKGHMA